MLVQTLEDLDTALAFVRTSEVLAYDTETTGLNPRKDRVIGFGASTALDSFYFPIYTYDSHSGELVPTGLDPRPLLEALATKKLLMFNASFDARFTKFDLGVDLLPALHCDVLLLKHTCDEEFPFGLKELAAKHFGADVKAEKQAMLESVKANGGKASEYYKADLGLISIYCQQDCKLTYRLYTHYSKQLRDEGLEAFYYKDEVLPLYKNVTIPMEERGVRLDIPLLQQTRAEIDAEITKLELQIQLEIQPHLGLFEKWFLDKDYPLKTFTGKVPAWAKRHDSQLEAWKMDHPYECMFNLRSRHHLKKLFFDTLQEQPLNRTPTGQPQADEEFLASVATKYAWVPLLQDYYKLQKIKSTYIERFIEEQEYGRFYASFQQHRTVSGRFAGDLQQLPRPLEDGQGSDLVRKYNNRIRQFFISDDGSMLMSADYEQLEPSIFAHTSGDPALQAIFNQGTDFYSEVAIRTEGLVGVSSDKQAPNYLGKVSKAARQKAKSYALGIAYGMTGYKLKFELGCSQAEADQLVQDYLNAFPKLKEWMNASREQACTEGRVSTEMGRVRRLQGARTLLAKHGSCISDDLQLWKVYHQIPAAYERAKADRKTFKNLLNNAINFQVQGLAASVVNRASIRIAQRLVREGYKAAICMQVHDELVLNVPENEVSLISDIVQYEMQNAAKLSVPLRTTPQIGKNFRECK